MKKEEKKDHKLLLNQSDWEKVSQCKLFWLPAAKGVINVTVFSDYYQLWWDISVYFAGKKKKEK